MPTFIPTPHLSARLFHGPLASIVPRYQAMLAAGGYTSRTSEMHLCLLANLNEWLERCHLKVSDLSKKMIDRYFEYRRRHFHTLPNDRSIVRKIIRLLENTGGLRHECTPTPRDPHRRVEDDYDRYLIEERGLALATRLNYGRFIDFFLRNQFGRRLPAFKSLTAKDIITFVQREAPHYSPKRAGVMVTALRSFLGFLRFRGNVRTDLAACVPGIATWTLSSLPRFLQMAQVRRVLRICDRRSAMGRRDYAVLLLLARLGLRAREVVDLTLDDVNWQAGEITIHGKGNKTSRLPLPSDVGEAIAAYLAKGRPSCPSRQVFLCRRAPRRGFKNSIAVSTIVARRLKQSGYAGPHTGAHVFRHTLATHMLQSGASFDEIAQLLRHQSFNTTALYAKVDLSALRPLAQPWPDGGAR
jgi:site-specific recombinase XerD